MDLLLRIFGVGPEAVRARCRHQGEVELRVGMLVCLCCGQELF